MTSTHSCVFVWRRCRKFPEEQLRLDGQANAIFDDIRYVVELRDIQEVIDCLDEVRSDVLQ
jgi:hypothetical protein